MTGLRVVVRPPTPEGRLRPRYVTGVKFLVLESQLAPWRHGINIDAHLILDLDEAMTLAHVEMLGSPFHEMPGLRQTFDTPAPAGDLAFAPDVVARQGWDLGVGVHKNIEAGIVRIGIGPANEEDRAVALSDDCRALLKNDELIGFLVRNFDLRGRLR
jgi:hypothetical protein